MLDEGAMPIQWPPSTRLEPLYDFPARAVLIPALKVGALTGKNSFQYLHTSVPCIPCLANASIILLEPETS